MQNSSLPFDALYFSTLVYPPWSQFYLSFPQIQAILSALHAQTCPNDASPSHASPPHSPHLKHQDQLPLLPLPLTLAADEMCENTQQEAPQSVDSLTKSLLALLASDFERVSAFFHAQLSDVQISLHASPNSHFYSHLQETFETQKSAAHLATFARVNLFALQTTLLQLDPLSNSPHSRIWLQKIQDSRLLPSLHLLDAASTTTTTQLNHCWLALTPSPSQPASLPSKPLTLLLSLLLAALLLLAPIATQQPSTPSLRCGALVAFVSCCWITEAMPFHITALSIPFLTVLLRILRPPLSSPGETTALAASEASVFVLASMFNNTIALLLGAFSLSAAFAKFKFEQNLLQFIHRKFHSHPSLYLLVFMHATMILSLFISNVAASILINAVLLPTLSDTPASNFSKSLLLAVAFAANLGGMISPISSPQNAIALSKLAESAPTHPIPFFSWLLFALPFCHLALLLLWILLAKLLPIEPSFRIPNIQSLPPSHHKPPAASRWKQLFVLTVTLLTILLWCTSSLTNILFGSLGIIGLLPLLLFFSTGILDKHDFHNFPWNLFFLVAGGNVLGLAIKSSGVLSILTTFLASNFQNQPQYFVFLQIVLVVSTVSIFVSHTVTAIVFLPLLIDLGLQLGYVELVVMAGAISCSSAMILPMSSFPNMNALLLEDAQGRPFLKVLDFIRYGGIFTPLLVLLFSTLGFLLLKAIF